MSLYVIGLLFVLVWLVITGSYTLANILFGVLVACLSLGLIRHRVGSSRTYWGRIPAIIALALVFIRELALSAFAVARLVLRPKMDLKPGIFAYELNVESDFEITLLANLITLTPGTLSVDVAQDRSTLYIHALDCSDIDATKRSIAEGFERRIMEAFRK